MPEEIQLNLYCDEIKESTIVDPDIGNQHWIYLGILIVPTILEDELISKICDLRCRNTQNKNGWGACKTQCPYHEKNDKEIHYKRSKSADVYHIARKWIEFACKDGIYTFFYILGLNLDNLDYSCFGNHCPSERFRIIYNRFFRTAVLKSAKSYFYIYDRIIIENIFHDNADISNHEYFPWHSIYRLERDDPKLTFVSDEIQFIDSDHHESNNKRSHLIQYIDVLMGSIFNALHWESQNVKKENLALVIHPLLQRMIKNPRNRNSSYNIHNRKSIDFFPSRRLYEYTDFPINGTFYKNREIRIDRKSQPRLF
jgi:hypothetical protein